jgi:KDEL-tailed cysteine endopeptidase
MMDRAFQYIVNNGLETEAAYPYKGKDGTKCKYAAKDIKAKITTYVDVNPNDIDALKSAVALQPVSVAIEADTYVFQSYAGGVIKGEDCGTYLDHGVLLVGYGTDKTDGDYWIVKNSWGADWGDNGYVKLAIEDGEGVCGVQMEPSYPQ